MPFGFRGRDRDRDRTERVFIVADLFESGNKQVADTSHGERLDFRSSQHPPYDSPGVLQQLSRTRVNGRDTLDVPTRIR
jgi:hypothetical protein